MVARTFSIALPPAAAAVPRPIDADSREPPRTAPKSCLLFGCPLLLLLPAMQRLRATNALLQAARAGAAVPLLQSDLIVVKRSINL